MAGGFYFFEMTSGLIWVNSNVLCMVIMSLARRGVAKSARENTMELLTLMLSDDVGRLSLLTIVVATLVVLGAVWAIFRNMNKPGK